MYSSDCSKILRIVIVVCIKNILSTYLSGRQKKLCVKFFLRQMARLLRNVRTYVRTITSKKTSSSNFTGGTSSKSDAIFFFQSQICMNSEYIVHTLHYTYYICISKEKKKISRVGKMPTHCTVS